MALVPSPMSVDSDCPGSYHCGPPCPEAPLYFLLQDSLEQLSPVGIVIVIKSSGFIS